MSSWTWMLHNVYHGNVNLHFKKTSLCDFRNRILVYSLCFTNTPKWSALVVLQCTVVLELIWTIINFVLVKSWSPPKCVPNVPNYSSPHLLLNIRLADAVVAEGGATRGREGRRVDLNYACLQLLNIPRSAGHVRERISINDSVTTEFTLPWKDWVRNVKLRW